MALYRHFDSGVIICGNLYYLYEAQRGEKYGQKEFLLAIFFAIEF